ncbi:MAG TPA: sigma-54 dependent transcriptional regulator [Candidatus Acidoferrales bacterium]|nr:sigma-54 dependent transcriptional regulator [Candidatus Acidoferrales bacterium]
MPHALVVDDDANFLLPLAELVEREGFTSSVASSVKAARELIKSKPPDLLVTDLFLPDGKGMDLLAEMDASAGTQVVLVTGHASVDTAIEALRKGATDYLTKPLDIPRLKTVLANVARAHALRQEVGSLRAELRKLGRFGSLVGASPAMQKVYDLINRVAPTDATVLVTGESGTGKELVAESVHAFSRRRNESFLPVNCGAISPNLIESELFGHERGSFTGADRMHKGYFERTAGGTIFLDEITEMPFELQVKLLRVLETSAVIRIGGEHALPIDVRVIAASNRQPEEAVAQGKLREDLLYRLKVFPIQLPPLRDRGDDVELLADYFLGLLNKTEGTVKTLSRAAVQRLRAHSWPGNVRELKNLVHQAFILADDEIGADCLPQDLGDAAAPAGTSLHLKVGISLEDAERRLIAATLQECGGDKKKAAEVLGISLKTLYNRLHAYDSGTE